MIVEKFFYPLLAYFRDGGPTMIFLSVCSMWMWILAISCISRKDSSGKDLVPQVNTILVLAGVAPLLGLLGTISGMISAFSLLSKGVEVSARELSHAIAEALITTQTGLTVGVLGMFLGHFLMSRVKKKQWIRK